jgi:hypothetical protein
LGINKAISFSYKLFNGVKERMMHPQRVIIFGNAGKAKKAACLVLKRLQFLDRDSDRASMRNCQSAH